MVQKQEMQILQSSFGLEDQERNGQGLMSLVASLGEDEDSEDVIKLSPEHAEAIRVSMERYIKER